MPKSTQLPSRKTVDDRIVAATTEILRDRGPLAVTVEAVAAASGVAKTTIYRRYEDRDALVRAAIDAATTEVDLPTELSMYDTSAKLISNFLLPLATRSRTVSRKVLAPSPNVILPAASTTVTSPTWRVVSLTLTLPPIHRSRFFFPYKMLY